MRSFSLVAILVVVCFSVCTARPLWGHTGHEVTAAIAASRLSDNAINMVHQILGSSESLVSVSTWADEIKHESQWRWSGNHFI